MLLVKALVDVLVIGLFDMLSYSERYDLYSTNIHPVF